MATRISLVLILAAASLLAKTPTDRDLQKACAFTWPKQHDLGLNGFKLKKNEQFQHTPVVSFSIDSDGNVTDVHMGRSSGIRRLDNAMLSAVKNWKFKPRANCPVTETQMSVTIDWF